MNPTSDPYLPLDGSLTLNNINDIIKEKINGMCFETQEENAINKASEDLASDFLNILTLYIKIQDIVDIDGRSALLLKAADNFVDNLKKHVSKCANRAASTGLLFTWVPIIMALNRSAREANATVFQFTTTQLELQVHKFAMAHLSASLFREIKNTYI